jgi:hypothetical protein
MIVTLELKPEVERRVMAQAAAQGVPLEAYLASVIEAALPIEPDECSLEEFEADMDALAEGSESLPVLPPEAFSRESIYGDHD